MVKLPEVITFAKIRGSYTVVASSFDRFLTNPGYEYNSQTHNWANPTVYPMDNMKPEKQILGNRFEFEVLEKSFQFGRHILSIQHTEPDI